MRKNLVGGESKDRLDVFISGKIPCISRSRARALIESGCVFVNGSVKKPSYAVSAGEHVTVEIPEEEKNFAGPENIPLDILYEDEHVLVVNKPAGMVTHPAQGASDHTLVNSLLWHTRRLSSVNGPLRPGIVHRLDKDTTGVLIVARTDEAHIRLAGQIRRREVRRAYRALVMGPVEPPTGEINAPVGRHEKNRVKFSVKHLGGRKALTAYRVLKKFRVGKESFSLLEVLLKTGRTHQIRVHFSSIGHPVCGDPKYGRKSPVITMRRQALHAEEVAFIHPATGEHVSFRAPLPADFSKQLEEIEKNGTSFS